MSCGQEKMFMDWPKSAPPDQWFTTLAAHWKPRVGRDMPNLLNQHLWVWTGLQGVLSVFLKGRCICEDVWLVENCYSSNASLTSLSTESIWAFAKMQLLMQQDYVGAERLISSRFCHSPHFEERVSRSVFLKVWPLDLPYQQHQGVFRHANSWAQSHSWESVTQREESDSLV